MLDDAEIRRILVVTAHPDDVDFAAAGTVARWTKSGIEVAYCVVTDGDAGERGYGMSRADVAAMRRAEQIAAAACVGVNDVRFLGYPDGRLEPSIGLRRDITRVIRQVRPDRLVCQSPERNYVRVQVSHPRPPGRRERRARCRLPGRAQPVRLPRARRRWPACLDGP